MFVVKVHLPVAIIGLVLAVFDQTVELFVKHSDLDCEVIGFVGLFFMVVPIQLLGFLIIKLILCLIMSNFILHSHNMLKTLPEINFMLIL